MTNPLRRQTLGDLLHRSAARHPEKLAVTCGETHWTYAEFDQLCDRLAAGIAKRGIGKGERLAVLARNSHGFAALRFALARLGAVLVPINFMFKAEEVAYILRHAGARTLAMDSGLSELGKAAAVLETFDETIHLVAVGRSLVPKSGMVSFDELASSTASNRKIELNGSDVAQIVYTSGTESLPKGAMLTHDAVMWQYVSCVVDANIAGEDLALHALPLYHCAQLDVFFGPAIYVGSSNVITAKPTPDNLLPLIERHQHYFIFRAADRVDFDFAFAIIRQDRSIEFAKRLLRCIDYAGGGNARNVRALTQRAAMESLRPNRNRTACDDAWPGRSIA